MKHVYFVDTKLICYYLFQRGSSISGMYDKIAQLLYNFPKGEIFLGWDIGKSSYRLGISPTYKGHRQAEKEKLSAEAQEALVNFNKEYIKMAELADLLPVYNLKVDGVECDDMCSIMAKRFENSKDHTVYLVTADMDWIHSVVGTKNISIIDVYNGGSLIDHKLVVETYNLDSRSKFTVLKSILGDKSDNIKFCNNIGPVKAKELFDKIYSKYKDPSVDEMILEIEQYLADKEADRIKRNLKKSISIHNDHIVVGRTTIKEAFLANLSIADPFQDTDKMTPEQLRKFNICLERVPPTKVEFEKILSESIDSLGYALQFGHRASKVFKVV